MILKPMRWYPWATSPREQIASLFCKRRVFIPILGLKIYDDRTISSTL